MTILRCSAPRAAALLPRLLTALVLWTPGPALAEPIDVRSPVPGVVTRFDSIFVKLVVPKGTELEDLEDWTATLDQVDVTDQLVLERGALRGRIARAEPGPATLDASFTIDGVDYEASIDFEAVDTGGPGCEPLNGAECLLPYPSSIHLKKDEQTATGLRMRLRARALPELNGEPLVPDFYNELDGFSPVTQILMSFPGGVDLVASDAPRLLEPECCGQPSGPPWIDTRTTDERSLDTDSPTLLIDAETGERLLHWVELDAAAIRVKRRSLIMRSGRALTPGRRYVVAVRNLVDEEGGPVPPEPQYRVLRDGVPTDIARLGRRRRHYRESIEPVLVSSGVDPTEVILAFDFTVRSDADLTGEMRSMRKQAYAWLEAPDVRYPRDESGVRRTFEVDEVEDFDCQENGFRTGRIVRGTFKSPLFLVSDPETDLESISFMKRDRKLRPKRNTEVNDGVTDAGFSIAIPCSLTEGRDVPIYPLLIGHGLFQTGDELVSLFGYFDTQADHDYIAGGTNWRGLSGQDDVLYIGGQVIGLFESKLNNFKALPDRLKQGMVNTLVLTRMMKEGHFNSHPAFQLEVEGEEEPVPAFPGPESEMYYFGISLGGINGTWLASLTPDIEKFNVDVPGMNFAMLLQRATPFKQFETLLAPIGLRDPMVTLVGLTLIQELWVEGEPGGYVHRLARQIERGRKKVLLTEAWLDKQVSNQATHIMARSLGLPVLEGSIAREMPEMEDVEGPVDSAMAIYDLGFFDILPDGPHTGVDGNGDFLIPPLANEIGSAVCDPHPRRLTLEASLDQFVAFMQPGGRIENFCDGLCDADTDRERARNLQSGEIEDCDPLPSEE